jgi:hypothetical protein
VKALVAQGASEQEAIAKVDFTGVESRYTHGDPFLKNRFHDYVSDSALTTAAYEAETGKVPREAF